jgi:hypothetical protein
MSIKVHSARGQWRSLKVEIPKLTFSAGSTEAIGVNHNLSVLDDLKLLCKVDAWSSEGQLAVLGLCVLTQNP